MPATAEQYGSAGREFDAVANTDAAATAAMVSDGELAARDTRFRVGKDGQRVALLYGSGLLREVDVSAALTQSGQDHLQSAAEHLRAHAPGVGLKPSVQARGQVAAPAL